MAEVEVVEPQAASADGERRRVDHKDTLPWLAWLQGGASQGDLRVPGVRPFTLQARTTHQRGSQIPGPPVPPM